MNTKTILTAFLLLCACKTAVAQDFSIFSTSEGISIKQNGEWVETVRNMTLKYADILYIPKGCQVEILEHSTSRIYTSSSSGEQSVAVIVVAARKRADSHIAAFNSTIRAAMSKDKSAREYSVTGVSYRGTGEFLARKVHAALSNFSNDTERTDSLILAFRTAPDGTGCFEATNLGTTPMVINIIGIRDGKMFLTLLPGYTENDPCVLLGPNESRLFTEYPFDASSMSGEYVLFGCEQAFDNQDLKQLMENNVVPEDTNPLPLMFSRTLSLSD